MKTASIKKSIPPGFFIHLFYLLFFAGLIFSFRAVNSLSIGALLLAGIFANKETSFAIFQNKTRKIFLAACILLFLLQLIALLYTNDLKQGWSHVRIKTGLV